MTNDVNFLIEVERRPLDVTINGGYGDLEHQVAGLPDALPLARPLQVAPAFRLLWGTDPL